MSDGEVKAYNTLVCAVQSNLLLTSMKGKISGMQDSLLHRSQNKHGRKALSNLRLSCCGGTRVVPTLDNAHWDETIRFLRYDHKLEQVRVQMVENYLGRAVSEQFSSCMRCGIELSTLLILPCGDLVCTECMKSETRMCPVCNHPFDADSFQELQPGIDYTWHWNISETDTKQASRTVNHPPVPAPALAPAETNDNETEAEGDQLMPLHVQENGPQQQAGQDRRRRRARRGDGHNCQYDRKSIDGKCELCHEEHDECVMVHTDSKCPICFRMPEPCPLEETKFHHVTCQLEALVAAQTDQKRAPCEAAAKMIGEHIQMVETRPVKVIIFSQFRLILNLIGHRLLRRFGAGAVAEYWGKYRRQELTKFQSSRDCFCMLLSKDGSEGLDLSFVTHIFFLEEIWDKSLENQTVARAWRMGAKGQVEVATLVAKNSVEEMMAEHEQRLSTQPDKHEEKEPSQSADHQHTRMVALLKNVKLMRRPTPLARSNTNEPKRQRTGPDDNPETKKRRVRFENDDYVA